MTIMGFSSSIMLCFLILLSLSSSSIATTIVNIPLTHFQSKQSLTHLATQSTNRAHHLKNPQNAPTSAPLAVHSYGGYSIPLSFGTPPQTLQFIMDTGSDVVWFPCTHNYLCKNCSFSGSDPTTISNPFIPKLSSTARILGCLNPKCAWIHHTNVTQCTDCEPGSRNCTEICPPYLILYVSGTTGGFGLVDTLNLPGKRVPNFLAGCSVFSSRQPAGIAGFGRGLPSLPSQLGLKKFSYCLLSQKFDDSTETTQLVLDSGSDSGEKTGGVSYTPFVKNPNVAGKDVFSVYYYLGLRKIIVGGKIVKVPYEYLSLGSDGNGGTIVDSGSTFTYMSRPVFELVLTQYVSQAKKYRRAPEVEIGTGLGLCFNVSGEKTVDLPEMKLHFRGGAEMVPPVENYFVIASERGAVCLAVVTDEGLRSASSGGPAIILGSFQMQNYYVEFDLRNERFGFKQQSCKQ